MFLGYFFDHLSSIAVLAGEHLRMSLLAVGIALPIAAVLAWIAIRFRLTRQPVLWIVGTLYTIPSLAMLAFLIPSQGLGLRPTLILLVMYAQVFLVRNFITGMTGVDKAALEAASGLGMSGWQRLRAVWLPMGLPVLLTGVRIALTTVIALAVLGGWVAAGGLGELLFSGIGSNNPEKVMAGVIAIVVLAVAVDLAMRALESLTPVARANRAARH